MDRESYFCLAVEKEPERIHAISHGAADDRDPVEYDRRLFRVLEKYLLEYIDCDGKHEYDKHGGEDFCGPLGEHH